MLRKSAVAKRRGLVPLLQVFEIGFDEQLVKLASNLQVTIRGPRVDILVVVVGVQGGLVGAIQGSSGGGHGGIPPCLFVVLIIPYERHVVNMKLQKI